MTMHLTAILCFRLFTTIKEILIESVANYSCKIVKEREDRKWIEHKKIECERKWMEWKRKREEEEEEEEAVEINT